MLEVRILPGEPTPLTSNQLRTFSGDSSIRRCDVECANPDQSRSIKTNKNQLRQVSLRSVRSITANRDQTKHSALDRMLTHQLSIHIAEVAERPALRGALSRANERRHKNVMLGGHKIVPGCRGTLRSRRSTLRHLNVAAGAADASRAMLLTSCRKVALLTAILGIDPMSEKQNRPFRLSFNPSLQGDFHGLRVISDGGLLQVRDLFRSLNP
jgi:hypothetical protein